MTNASLRKPLSPGKQRGLDTLATDEGVFAVLAIDHRESLKAVLDGDPTDAEITDFKLDLIRGVGSLASGVMLEARYSLPQAINTGALVGSCGYMAALESQGYVGDPWAGPTTMMDGFSAADAKAMGASVAKMLLPYSVDRPEHAQLQEAVVAEVSKRCTELDLALLVEPVAFGMANEDRTRLVVESARRLTDSGLDILKVEFPGNPDDRAGWASACAAVNEVATVPWVLLSSGVTFEEYRAQLEVAFKNGCSGFTGGRAIWSELAKAPRGERSQILAKTIRPRMEDLRSLAVANGTPWRQAARLR